MKAYVVVWFVFVAILLNGCDNKQAKTNVQQTILYTPSPVALNPTPSSPTATPTKNVDAPLVKKDDITFHNQKQVEQLIKTYFEALKNKDYASAWELLDSRTKERFPISEALKNHFGIDFVELISMKGYLPPSLPKTGEVPPNTPTVWFMVELNIDPNSQGAWGKGINVRFVMVTKESDGKWKIAGLATSP